MGTMAKQYFIADIHQFIVNELEQFASFGLLDLSDRDI